MHRYTSDAGFVRGTDQRRNCNRRYDERLFPQLSTSHTNGETGQKIGYRSLGFGKLRAGQIWARQIQDKQSE